MIRRSQSPLRKSSSHAVQSNGDLDSLRKLYNSLSASLLSKGDNTDEVVKQLQIFPGYLTDVVSNNKFSSTDLIFISQTFEKVADFLGTDGRSKRSKLIPMFCKPLRSRTLINKLNSPEPIIEGYTTLIKSFKDLLDEHFDELVICFLRFLSGRSAAIFNSTEEIEKELNKPIDSKSSKLVLNCAYPSHLDSLLEIVCGTLRDAPENPDTILGRVDELSTLISEHVERFEVRTLLKTWAQLADIMKNHIRETDDINQGNLTCPDFSTTFGLLRLIFKIANCADEDFDTAMVQKCCSLFGQLYAEAQNTVRRPSLEFNPLGEIAPFVDALKVIQKALTELTTSAEIRNMFLTLSDLLKDMYDMFFGDDIRFKDVSRGALDAYLVILDLVKKKISGPYDDILLSGCAPLMAQLLGGIGGRRSKLRVAAAELWNVTFAKAKSLTYPKELRAKRSFSPVDSQADNTVASKRKAVSEDEIPPSPVVKVEEEPEKQNQKSQNPKFKKNQLTPVRYATAGTKRRNYVSLLDEDSVDYVPIPSTDSAKKMKLTDRQKEIFSEKSSLNNNVPVPVAVKEEPVIENGDADEPMETVALASEDAKGFFVDTAADSNNSDDAAVKRRSKIKLNFDKVDGPASHIQIIEPNLESEDSVESSGEASAELSGDSDVEQIKQMEKPPRSRRTQKKGTPTKYVAKKRRSIVKNTEKEKTRRQSRTSTVNVEVVEVAKIAADVEGSKEVIKDKNAVESEEMQPLPEIEDVLTNQGSRDLDGKSRESGNAMTSEKNSEDAEKVATAMTPSLVQRLGGTPGILKKVNSPSTAEKKLRRVHFDNNFENNAADSASTIIEEADKVSTIDEQFPASPKGTLKVITPRRPFAHVQPAEEKTATTTSLEKDDPSPVKIEGDSEDLPIFADLMECQESIAKIVGKLVPVSTNTGSITLRKTLEARGIVQIRHLASMSRREIAALNIKRPRVETTLKALTQFARDYVPPANKPLFKAASVPETETAAVPSEEPPAVLPEGIVEEENAVIENAHPDGEDKLEEIVATGDVAEAATVSPTKEAAEPAEMLNSEECSVEQPQPDPSLVYAEKLRQWKETGMFMLFFSVLRVLSSVVISTAILYLVLEANRQFELAMQAAEESGLSPGEIRSKRGLLMMVNGCVEMIAAPYSSR
ncbi:hypothetical protein ANCCEY_09949 [Ancylostoma ceylanicum]|uniref:Telomere-associated protein Rif1 N-terminal domain-containing protein n=1 Tax=Ancylostoma ceylanicum TaxID=53326 RepID=A0A0D6LFW6_9BILA|nr:hypothetical protein ANCCEY_09949 [Ancylostoma ceylanicum]